MQNTDAKKINVMIADDHSIVRMGIAAMLKYQADIEVTGEAEDGEEAVRLAETLRPDVVIMDLVMQKMDGATATETIKKLHPEVKVIVITTFWNSADVTRAISKGASGAIMKGVSSEELVKAIRDVAAGQTVFSPEILQFVQEKQETPEFTERQQEILHSVSRGLTNADIAKMFGISVDGVKRHLLAIFRKLGAANRSEAVTIAIRHHILKI